MTMDDMTKVDASELATYARDAQDGAALMRGADRQMKQAHAQWIEGALKAAGALYAARQRLVDHAVFGKWCGDNGLGAAVITKDERAALIKIGADLPYWRETLAKTESRSLRLITAKQADPFSHMRQAPSTAAPAPSVTKTATADPIRSAPVRTPPSAKTSVRSPPVDDDEVEPEMDPMRQHTPIKPDVIYPAKTVPDGNGWDVSDD